MPYKAPSVFEHKTGRTLRRGGFDSCLGLQVVGVCPKCKCLRAAHAGYTDRWSFTRAILTSMLYCSHCKKKIDLEGLHPSEDDFYATRFFIVGPAQVSIHAVTISRDERSKLPWGMVQVADQILKTQKHPIQHFTVPKGKFWVTPEGKWEIYQGLIYHVSRTDKESRKKHHASVETFGWDPPAEFPVI